MLDLQDHFEALVYILAGGRTIPDWLRPVHSHKLHPRKSTDAEDEQTESPRAIRPEGCSVSGGIAAAGEWTDVELLFRTLASLKLNH